MNTMVTGDPKTDGVAIKLQAHYALQCLELILKDNKALNDYKPVKYLESALMDISELAGSLIENTEGHS